MFQSLTDFIMGVAFMLIVTCLALNVSEFLYRRVRLHVDPGCLIGVGLAGCIGVIGIVLGLWDGFTCVFLCLLGGCIGSGMYRFNEDPNVHHVGFGQNALQ